MYVAYVAYVMYVMYVIYVVYVIYVMYVIYVGKNVPGPRRKAGGLVQVRGSGSEERPADGEAGHHDGDH